MQQSRYSLYGAVTFAFASTLMPGGAGAAELFEGKQVKVIVGYAAGGGYDIYGRQLARHIGKHLPGKPSVIVQNMAGAGGVIAVNYLYNQAPKDGTQFGIFARSMPVLALAGKTPQVKFDALKLTWIGTSSSYKGEAYLLAVRKDTGITSMSDLQRAGKELKFASTGFGSDGHDVPLILREVFGINVQVVRGYPGGNTLYLAVDRGEMHARMVGFASVKAAHPEWLKPDSPVRFILQFATENRLPEFPDVPTARELTRNQTDKDLIALLEAPFYMARPFAGPPNIPAANTKALRTAFMAAHADPDYVAEAKKLRLDTSPLDGEAVTKRVEALAAVPKEIYDRYSAILENPKSELRQVQWQIVEGTISNLGKKGRFEFESAGKTLKARMSGGYTQIKVGGKEAKAKAIKVGMFCKIWYEGDGSYAGQMECR